MCSQKFHTVLVKLSIFLHCFLNGVSKLWRCGGVRSHKTWIRPWGQPYSLATPKRSPDLNPSWIDDSGNFIVSINFIPLKMLSTYMNYNRLLPATIPEEGKGRTRYKKNSVPRFKIGSKSVAEQLKQASFCHFGKIIMAELENLDHFSNPSIHWIQNLFK